MIPLNVTHQAIVTNSIHTRLLSPSAVSGTEGRVEASSNLRHSLSTLILFFKETYRSTFGFEDGPPLHDALTIAYISRPQLFTCKRYRTDVELTGLHTTGETIVDIWDYRASDDSWGTTGKNCNVAEGLDVGTIFSPSSDCPNLFGQVAAFFEMFLECVTRCDRVSPLNESN